MIAMGSFADYFRQSGGGDHEVRIWRSQIGVILLYVSALSVAFFKHELLLAAVGVFAIISLLGFADYDAAERYFFGGLVVLGILLSATQFFFVQFEFMLLVGYVILFAAFFAVFYLAFRRAIKGNPVLIWTAVQQLFPGSPPGTVSRTKSR